MGDPLGHRKMHQLSPSEIPDIYGEQDPFSTNVGEVDRDGIPAALATTSLEPVLSASEHKEEEVVELAL